MVRSGTTTLFIIVIDARQRIHTCIHNDYFSVCVRFWVESETNIGRDIIVQSVVVISMAACPGYLV